MSEADAYKTRSKAKAAAAAEAEVKPATKAETKTAVAAAEVNPATETKLKPAAEAEVNPATEANSTAAAVAEVKPATDDNPKAEQRQQQPSTVAEAKTEKVAKYIKTRSETEIGKMYEESGLESLVQLLTTKFSNDVGGKGAEAVLPEFDGETNIKRWFSNFEANAEAYKWSDLQKFVFATNKMTKTAKVFLQTVAVTDYKELKSQLLEEFDREYNGAEIHEMLRARVKKETETFHEYIIKMRQLGDKGNIDSNSIIRYIVDGIKGRNELKIGMYGAKDFKELKRQFEIFEHFIANKSQQNDKKQSFDSKKKKDHCFNCGSTDHKKADCKAAEPKCFKCNRLGHISRNCTTEVTKKVPVLCLVDTGAEVSLVKKISRFKVERSY